MTERILIGISKTKRRKILAKGEIDAVEVGDHYIVTNENIKEIGEVLKKEPASSNAETDWSIVKKAGDHDLLQQEINQEKADKAITVAQQFADKRSLQMKVIGSEYSLEKAQLKFYFKSPHRVDFRGLVKALAHKYSTRIELEQVGPREAASIIGGLGRCGRELCCRRFLYEPGPIPMEIAEKQGLSVSPNRLTGVCGRLLCCLEYELEDYVKSLEKMPDKGSDVKSPGGNGVVVKRNVQKKTLRVKFNDEEVKEFSLDEVELLDSG